MKRRLRVLPVLSLVLLLAAAIFRFALIGYGFMALTCLGLAVVLLCYDLCLLYRKKGPAVALSIVLLAGLVLFLITEIPCIRASKGTAPDRADYLIVLGAGVHGETPSLSLVNRLDAALAYLSDHPDCRAIVSGGQGGGENITEAEAMYRYLTARGIDPSRLIQEPQATTTRENLLFSLDILRDLGVNVQNVSLAVVSSEYHLYRASLLASSLGLDVDTLPGRTTLPLLKVNYFIREAFALWYFRLFGV